MTRVLTSSQIILCIYNLDDATRWLATVTADVGPAQARRIGYVAADIAHVRNELMLATASDVVVETPGGA